MTTIGHYEIREPLGKGGMGEVFRAFDTRLKREVALKLLPESFAADPERMARFQREAELLAALNHPNIAHVYGVEDRALVMELVEGETLKGPKPLDQALAIADQIAEALSAAHERGIIHRDLKPANIMITHEGVVKLLDFGLAKAAEEKPGDASNSPTITMSPTRAGMILGTAAYMSPEQARGKNVDRRTDIWAFGCVLYEMLTGKQAFHGETVSDIIASVLAKEPELDAAPARVRRLLKKCFEKDPRQRLQAIGDYKLLLEEARLEPYASGARASKWPWVVAAGAFALLSIALSVAWWRGARAVDQPFTQFAVDLGPDAIAGQRTTVAISRDGRRIAFPTRNGLATRALDQANSTLLLGTVGAEDPFFSPDGRSIGFFADGKLKKIAIEAGAPVSLVDAVGDNDRGGSWGDDGYIVFAPTGSPNQPLIRVAAEGGTPSPLTKLDSNSNSHRWPQVLPGAAAVLFTASPQAGYHESDNIVAHTLKTGQQKVLARGAYFGRFLAAPNGKGFLLYVHEGTIFGAPFDPGRLELLAPAAPLITGVAADNASAGGQFDVSQSGALVYQSGRSLATNTFAWMDNTGRISPSAAKPNSYIDPRFSPSGKRLAYGVSGPGGRNLWTYDIARETPTQLTFTGGTGTRLTWTPDEAHLVYSTLSVEHQAIWWIRADGSAPPDRLLEAKSVVQPGSFTPDGRRLVYVEAASQIRALPLDLTDPEHPKPGQPEPIPTRSQALDPAISSDGHWLAYSSAESGPRDVFVQPFPGPGARTRISTEGGRFPVWSRKEHQLLFLANDDHIMAVEYTIQGGNFEAGRPRRWSPIAVLRVANNSPTFDLHPDGKRLVVFPKPESDESRGGVRATFLLNYAQELERRFGGTK
jgi:serine/threonine-protein kinase